MSDNPASYVYGQIRHLNLFLLLISIFVILGLPGHVKKYEYRNEYSDFQKESLILPQMKQYLKLANNTFLEHKNDSLRAYKTEKKFNEFILVMEVTTSKSLDVQMLFGNMDTLSDFQKADFKQANSLSDLNINALRYYLCLGLLESRARSWNENIPPALDRSLTEEERTGLACIFGRFQGEYVDGIFKLPLTESNYSFVSESSSFYTLRSKVFSLDSSLTDKGQEFKAMRASFKFPDIDFKLNMTWLFVLFPLFAVLLQFYIGISINHLKSKYSMYSSNIPWLILS